MLQITSLNFYILGAAAILLIGFLGRAIAKKTGVPHAVWLIIFGIAIVSVFGLLSQASLSSMLPFVSSLVILILLFNAGLSLHIKKIMRSLSRASSSAFINFTVSAVFVFFFMYFLNFGTTVSIITALVTGSVSAEVISTISKNVHPSDKNKNLIILESAITEPLCIILVLVIIAAIALNTYQIPSITSILVSEFSIGIVLAAIMAMAWIPLMSYLQKNRYKYSYAASLALVFVLYILVQDIGGSAPVSALIFGLVIANGEDLYKTLRYKHRSSFTINSESREFNDLITFFTTSFFFVYFGGLLNLNDYYCFALGAAIALVILIARQISTRAALYKSQFSQNDKAILSYMIPRGTGAAVAATLPVAYGILNLQFLDIIVAVIFTTILINGILLLKFKGNIEALPPHELAKRDKASKNINKYV